MAAPTIQTNIDTRIYQVVSIQKAAYRVAAKCTVVLGAPNGDQLPLTFAFRPNASEIAADEAVRLFHQELLDEELRAVIREETQALRSLILAHTFSRTDLVQR